MRFKYTLNILIILSLLCSCEKHISPFEKAKILIKEKDYQSAIELLNTIIQENPKFDSAYIRRGYAFMMIQDYDNSLNDYNHALINPRFKIPALIGRGFLYINSGNFQGAMEDLTKVIKLDPQNFNAYYGRAITKTQLRIYGPDPDTSSMTIRSDERGTFHYDYKGAFDDFNKALELNAKFADAYLKRGDLYIEINKSELALKDYSEAIKCDSNYVEAYSKRAVLYEDLDMIEEALKDFKTAIRLNPTDPYLYRNRGLLKENKLKDLQSAKEDYKTAEKLGYKFEKKK